MAHRRRRAFRRGLGHLSRDAVLRAAIDLADEKGIGPLSMRVLARSLGVEAMSLYNHVSSKDDLLDGMVDLVVGEIDLPPEKTGWREAMRRRAVSALAVFSRHPWVSALMDSRTSSGPARLRYLDWVIGKLRSAGFPLALAARAFSVLDSYVYGFGRQRLNMTGDGTGSQQEAAEAFLRYVPAGEYPFLTEMIVDDALISGYDEKADFAFGLELILDGLQSVLGSTRGPVRPGPSGR